MSHDREAAEAKFDAKRRTMKEFEATMTKNLQGLEREKAVLLEKTQNMEKKAEESEKAYEEELGRLKEQLTGVNAGVAKDKQVLVEEADKLKKQILELEKENSEINSNYERDKVLWEGKCTFLEQQKDQAKKDMQEAQQNFSLTIEKMQNEGEVKKNKTESTQMAIMNAIERKYKDQLKEMAESNQLLITELT